MSDVSDFEIRIGNQTSFAAASALEPFEFALARGFDAFEFFPDRGFSGLGGWDERDLDLSVRQRVRRAARENGLELTVHAPLAFDPLRHPEDERLSSTIAFAAEIGASLVNLHLDLSQGVERFGEALAPALLATARSGLQLTLENTVHTGPEDFNRIFDWIGEGRIQPFGHVGMCFDLGHANLCAATRNDYLGFLDRLSGRVPIRHLHLHENYGERDQHLTLFTGPAGADPRGLRGLVERLRRRRFNGCAILEQWPQPPALLVSARDRLRDLLSADR